MQRRRRLQFAAVGVFIAAYAGLSHYSNSAPQAQSLGVTLALGPVLTLGFVVLWRGRRPLLALLAAAAAALFLFRFWPLLERNFSVVYLLQECGFYGLMAASFGLSLRPGGVALCTRFADKAHGPLSPREVLYTRRVTAAWAMFFVGLLAVTLSLFAFAPLRTWSLFSNFWALPLVGVMFVAEYAVRRRRLPQLKRNGLVATMKIYFANSS